MSIVEISLEIKMTLPSINSVQEKLGDCVLLHVPVCLVLHAGFELK